MKIKLSHREDRKYLAKLSAALGISHKNIIRDELDYWNIKGSKGFINTDTRGWYIYADGNQLEQRLSFMEPRMNGLSFTSDEMPNPEQAEIVRNVVGLKKKREYSAEYLEQLKSRLKGLQKKGVS